MPPCVHRRDIPAICFAHKQPGNNVHAAESSSIVDTPASIQTARVPYLPPEILRLIANLLLKSDLKCLRVVSKSWHALVTDLLFDRVFVSPRARDLEVLKSISAHATIRTKVKELIYDTSHFSHMSGEDYFARAHMIIEDSEWSKSHSQLIYPRNFRRFVRAVHANVAYDVLLRKYANTLFIRKGFEDWQRYFLDEKERLDTGTFFSDFCTGIKALPNLRRLTMNSGFWNQRRWLLDSHSDFQAEGE